MRDKNQDEGALWSKVTDDGRKYLSGFVRIGGVEHKVFINKNSRKTDETFKPEADKSKWPDYEISFPDSVKKSAQAAAAPAPASTPAKSAKPAPKKDNDLY